MDLVSHGARSNRRHTKIDLQATTQIRQAGESIDSSNERGGDCVRELANEVLQADPEHAVRRVRVGIQPPLHRDNHHDN